MTPENKVKKWLIDKLKKVYPDIWIYKPPGGAYGKKGVPDIICCTHGLFISIEVKATPTGVTSPMQLRQLDLIGEAGGIACTIKGKDEAKFEKLCKVIDRNIINLNRCKF